MSAAAIVNRPLKIKMEPIEQHSVPVVVKKEPATESELLAKLKADNPPGVCLGVYEASVELFEPEEFKRDAKYHPVRLEYVGKRPKEIYDFEVVSKENSEFLGNLSFKDATKLGPLAGSRLVQWEAVMPVQKANSKSCPLWITLYCRADEYEHAAENIQMYQLFLKKPLKFHPAAEYRNPFDKPIKGFHDLFSRVCGDSPTENHLKDSWVEDENGQWMLKGMNVHLLDHQVTGINWMMDREKNEHTRGGFLADMGLGKTVQTIGLLVSSMAPSKDVPKRTTLIIVTNALMSQWEAEIKNKLKIRLTVFIWHGPDRKKISSLDDYDVVITTYGTLRSDLGTAPLFTTNWYRVVLDEAQNIKTHTTKGAMASCSLKARYRWCLSGTPVGAKVIELYSYFRFLQLQPVCNLATFQKSVGCYFKEGAPIDLIAVEKVRTILSTIMLRRSKALMDKSDKMLDLPARIKEDVYLDFEADDRILYDVLRLKAKELIPKVEKNGKQYSNALAFTTRCRQACNNFYLVLDKLEGFKDLITPSDDEDETDDGDQVCELCKSACSGNANQDTIFCKKCKDAVKTAIERKSKKTASSTKINRMLEILEETRKTHPKEKTIIFSQYTSMLDLIEFHLKKHDFDYCRYDGEMTTQNREKSLNRLRTDNTCNVMLISLKCGSVGLNLTAANRVILIDPWWTPAVEEQAIDRVHRYGQTLPVYVKRLIINNSIEERVLALQNEKLELIRNVLNDKKPDLSMDNIKFLFDIE